MNPTDRIPAGFSPGTPGFDRLKFMLGHYDFRVYVSDTAYVEVGAGSLAILKRLGTLPGGHVGLLGTIGRFCEFADTAKIIPYGDHDNDKVVNITFGGFPLLRGRVKTAGKPYAPFSIGNAVLASENALILSGRSIGDGVVLGASAVVTRDLEPHGIYAGVPAKRLRDRPTGAAWWDFDVAYLFSNLENIEAVAKDRAANHVYRRPSPKFVLRAGKSLEILGALDGDRLMGFSQMPERVRSYIIQAMTAEQPYWMADCWAGVNAERPA